MCSIFSASHIFRGLGKSIQAIALIWTCLRQGPTGNPVARKAVVVCPSSLVGNWAKEIDKWLKGALKCVQLGEVDEISMKFLIKIRVVKQRWEK